MPCRCYCRWRCSPRPAAAGLYGLGVVAFFLVATGSWLAWTATEYGTPAALAAMLAERLPGDAPTTGAVAVAALYSIGGLAALYGARRSPERPLVAWALTSALLLGLTMTLHLARLDAGKGYRDTFVALKQALPADYRCVAGEGLGEPQRAMLDYYAGLRSHRPGTLPAAGCDLLLAQEQAGALRQMNEREWELLWQGARPGDAKELFRLFRRR